MAQTAGKIIRHNLREERAEDGVAEVVIIYKKRSFCANIRKNY